MKFYFFFGNYFDINWIRMLQWNFDYLSMLVLSVFSTKWIKFGCATSLASGHKKNACVQPIVPIARHDPRFLFSTFAVRQQHVTFLYAWRCHCSNQVCRYFLKCQFSHSLREKIAFWLILVCWPLFCSSSIVANNTDWLDAFGTTLLSGHVPAWPRVWMRHLEWTIGHQQPSLPISNRTGWRCEAAELRVRLVCMHVRFVCILRWHI